MKLKDLLFDIWDVIRTYVVFIVFNRWNKLTERHFRFLEDAGWVVDSKTKIMLKIKRALYNKLKEINKNNIYEE